MSNLDELLKCPISKERFRDPVTLECGDTFDRDSLAEISQKSVCPECGKKVVTNNLPTNTRLKQIKECVEQKYPELLNRSTILNCENNVTESQAISSEKSNIKNKDCNEVMQDEESSKNKGNSKINSTIKNTEPLIDLPVPQPFKATFTKHDDVFNLQITPSDTLTDVAQRKPISVVCVIDTSASMGTTVGQAEGKKAFTRLDMVKHVLNVLIKILTPADNLALITFSYKPILELPLQPMNEIGKGNAGYYVVRMKNDSSTQTVPAIEMAYDVIKKAPENSIKSIILLTDGQDTDGEANLINCFDKMNKPNDVQLNTFGFSNDIWSQSLDDIAEKGGGIFSFIPDQSMIGTVFIEFLANLQLTHTQNVNVNLDPNYSFMFRPISTEKVTFQYGQSKHFILVKNNGKLNEPMKIKLEIPNGNNKPCTVVELTATERESTPEDNKCFKQQAARMKFLELLKHPHLPNVNLELFKTNQYLKLDDFLAEMDQIHEYNPNHEQVKLALENYKEWGEAYIRSLCSAHKNEQRLNFRSPSMNIYATPLFEDLVDKITDIFVSMPLPQPTGVYINDPTNATRLNTRNLMDRDSGCILGTCNIKMENGEYKQINKLKKGDILYGGARIVCLIKTRYHGSLIKIGKLFITPFHPVFIENKWQFPYDVVMNNNESSSTNGLIIESGEGTFVFNLVLDKDHIVDVEGVGCITLGHMYDEGILKHDYFGTNKVIEHLSKLNGWNEGIISLKSYKIQRDSNGNVSGTSCHVYQL